MTIRPSDETYWVGRLELDWNARPWENPKRVGVEINHGVSFKAFQTGASLDLRDPETFEWRHGRIELAHGSGWYFVESDHYAPLGSPEVYTVLLQIGDLVRVKRSPGD